MSVASQSARPARGQFTDAEFDLPALGAALWRKRWKILRPTILVGLVTLRRRPDHHAQISVGIARPHRRARQHLPAPRRRQGPDRPQRRRPGGGDQPGAAHAVARSRQRSDRQAQARRAAGIRSGARRRVAGQVPARPARHRQESAEHDAGRARAGSLLRPAHGVSRWKNRASSSSNSCPRIRNSPRSVANAIADAYLVLQQQAKQEQARAPASGLPARSTTAQEGGRRRSQGRGLPRQIQPAGRHQQHHAVGAAARRLQCAARHCARAEGRRRGQGEADPRHAANPASRSSSSDILNSELIRRLSEQRVTLRAQLAEQSSTLLDNHPRIKELKAQIADLDSRSRHEAATIARSLENDAKLADARVDSQIASLDQLKNQAATTNERGRAAARARARRQVAARSAWNPISPNIARRPRATPSIRRRPTPASFRAPRCRTCRPIRRSCRPC